MEVEDCYSAKSECYGAFERRRETSTMADFTAEMADFKADIASAMAEQLREIKAMLAGMMMNQNRSTTGGMRMNQNQSARVQGASETTGRVEYFFRMTSGDEQMLDGDDILGGDAYEDDSSVPLKGRGAFTSIRGVERSLGGAINGIAICGAGVFAGRTCEFCASDGTFCEANVGGDGEKYEDDFSSAEYSTVACGRMFGAGMCFANLNVECVFLYFRYEYVKCECG